MRLPFGRCALGALAGEELWDSRTPGRDVEATNLLLSTYGMGLIAEGEEKQLIPRISFSRAENWVLVVIVDAANLLNIHTNIPGKVVIGFMNNTKK